MAEETTRKKLHPTKTSATTPFPSVKSRTKRRHSPIMTSTSIITSTLFLFSSAWPSLAVDSRPTTVDFVQSTPHWRTHAPIHPPCPFNPGCTCSKGGPDLGEVTCAGSILADIPSELNNTVVYKLKLVGNGLRVFEEDRLHGTGLWRVEIRENGLTGLKRNSLAGLERSLWELDLRDNKLSSIPTESLASLTKLRVLDLSGNSITEIKEKDFLGLGSTLRALRLASNSLSRLPQSAFKGLLSLERLDLRDNAILFLHDEAFAVGPVDLKYLDLSGNLLTKIPFMALAPFRQLAVLEVSRNLLTSPYDVHFQGTISVGKLVLDYNQIVQLEPFSFQNFVSVNVTSFTGNPLVAIGPEAFKDAKIKEIIINYTNLWYLTQDSFDGLQGHLTTLDLSYNNLTSLPQKIFEKHDFLHTLSVRGNMLTEIPHSGFNGFQYTLRNYDFIGTSMSSVSKQDLQNMRNLRKLGFSLGGKQVLTQDALEGVGPAVLHLDLSWNRLKRIEPEAFKHVPTLKNLDLSNNLLANLDDKTFVGVNPSLETLIMRKALARSGSSWGKGLFWGFTSLVTLDLRSNGITVLRKDDFRDFSSLKEINLDHNLLSEIPNGLFSSASTPNVEIINVKFNRLEAISQGTFSKLEKLKEISLSENMIKSIDKKAFSDLDDLQYLDLTGNQLRSLPSENIWQNLPRLELLTLANNELETFNMDSMEQVGNLANFRLDLSQNKIQNLSLPENLVRWKNHFNIKFLNLSGNNISKVDEEYFEPLTNSLISLDLSDNSLAQLTKAVAGRKPYLQILSLNRNQIKKIKRDACEGSWNILEIYMRGNVLEEFPEEFFKNKTRIRVADLSGNSLKAIPEALLENNRLEVLQADDNVIDRFPDFSVKPLPTLRKLSLSGNKIERIRPTDIITLRNLVSLDVSNNKLDSLDAGLFGSFHKIVHFDASGNPLGDFDPGILDNLEDLEELCIAEAGLLNVTLPPLSSLLSLNVSFNSLTELDSSTLGQTPYLKELDVTGNNLTSLDSNAWMMIPFLSHLRAADNPVIELKNSSLVGLQRLQVLDIRRLLDLENLETGALAILPNLKYLKFSDYPELGDENEEVLARTLSAVPGLERLRYDVVEALKVGNLYPATAPPTLKGMEVRGEGLIAFKSSLFSGLTSPTMDVTIRDLGIEVLPVTVFENMGRVFNLKLDFTNANMSHVGNPERLSGSGAPNRVHPTWLDSIKLGGSNWRCDCAGMGWMEEWLESDREVPCRIGFDWYLTAVSDCPEIVVSFRTAKCRREGKSVLRTFVEDLDCSSAPRSVRSTSSLLLLPIAGALLVALLAR